MQNTDARVAGDGLPGVMTPAGDPFSVMLVQACCRSSQPGDQDPPPGPDPGRRGHPRVVLVAVAGGERREIHTDRADVRAVDARAAASGAGLRAGRRHRSGSHASDRSSSSWCRLRAVFGPRSQVPCPGLAGVPVAEQRGQGCARLPVMYVSEVSGTFVDEVPVDEVERAGSRRRPGVQHADGERPAGESGSGSAAAYRSCSPCWCSRVVLVLAAGTTVPRADVAGRAAAAEREPALRAVGCRAFRNDGGAAAEFRPPQLRVLTSTFEASLALPQVPLASG